MARHRDRNAFSVCNRQRRGQHSDPKLRPLKVDEKLRLFDLCPVCGCMEGRNPVCAHFKTCVREVQPAAVHTGTEHRLEDRFLTAGGTERSEKFNLIHICCCSFHALQEG